MCVWERESVCKRVCFLDSRSSVNTPLQLVCHWLLSVGVWVSYTMWPGWQGGSKERSHKDALTKTRHTHDPGPEPLLKPGCLSFQGLATQTDTLNIHAHHRVWTVRKTIKRKRLCRNSSKPSLHKTDLSRDYQPSNHNRETIVITLLQDFLFTIPFLTSSTDRGHSVKTGQDIKTRLACV